MTLPTALTFTIGGAKGIICSQCHIVCQTIVNITTVTKTSTITPVSIENHRPD